MKSWQLEDQYAIIFHMGDWRERGVWGRLFQKELQFTEPEIPKMSKNDVNWVEKGRFGVWGRSYWSELRSECNGKPPGAQKGPKKSKNVKNSKNPENPGFAVFSYSSLSVPIEPGVGSAAWGAARKFF